ncbi:hypothetical protein PHG01_01745 [Streptococcus mutans PKUSS-HG01]|nr:hypothetical protein PHG01_01745 [Streptococcus mutans PKUSS-HG01]
MKETNRIFEVFLLEIGKKERNIEVRKSKIFTSYHTLF